ncbi:hypothetical protein L1D56_19350 [Vibrio diabolicus]|uniref:hypothetical protein n=1 Tax=Vibrio diabolicus TaxID=50719 RepID=UPI00211B2426|nr:hypothetical protein [Vibrio diabolicus]MCG9622103.1 hypothetical protein [Vibrio diabolicus]
MLHRKFGITIAILTLTGCSTAPITLNYAPSSTMSAEGSVNVGDFKYLPGEVNPDVKPNQIRNTALGDILFEKNVDEYFEKAVFTESRFIGIKVGNSQNEVFGEIREFLIDDLGSSIDWTLDVSYRVNSKGDRACYNKVHRIEKNTAKFVNVFGTLNEIMKLNIEQAFADQAFLDCIAQ